MGQIAHWVDPFHIAVFFLLVHIFRFLWASTACFACPDGTPMLKHRTCGSFVLMGGHTYGKCLRSISRRLFLALVAIIIMRNDNGSWQIVGCVVWLWFRLTRHEYTKSCTPAIKYRAANHMPELCWIICIDTVWECHACFTWKGQAPICFQHIAMTVLLYVTAGQIRITPTIVQSFSSWQVHRTLCGYLKLKGEKIPDWLVIVIYLQQKGITLSKVLLLCVAVEIIDLGKAQLWVRGVMSAQSAIWSEVEEHVPQPLK